MDPRDTHLKQPQKQGCHTEYGIAALNSVKK